MQTLKSLILKLDGARAGRRCAPQISFPYTRMCHLFRFSFLPWWKCPVQSQGQLQNVWDFILPRVRSGNLSQTYKMEQSVSKAPRTSRSVAVRAATQRVRQRRARSLISIWLSPVSAKGAALLPRPVCFGGLLLPSVTFRLKINLNLHYFIRAVKRFL